MREFDQLLKTIKILRSRRGCPWDRAQKIKDFKKYLLEECYELIDALESKDLEKIKEEIGDLFIILVSLDCLLNKNKKFTLKKILKAVNEKLILRHPHVFSSLSLKDKDQVLRHWIKEKARVKRRRNISERLPSTAPSLLLSEIFFKELNSSLPSKEVERIKQSIIENLKTVKRLDKKTVENVLFNLCWLAYFSKINLEFALREKIFKEARKVRYE